MVINGKKYRILETNYADGHKEYKAQYAISFILFKIWRDVVCHTWKYGFGSMRFICCGKTYDDCLENLKETLRKQDIYNKENKVMHKNKLY